MKKKIVIQEKSKNHFVLKAGLIPAFFMIFILMISGVSALDELKPAKLNEHYLIFQTCVGCSYVNITISDNEGIILENVAMLQNSSSVWVYEIIPTTIGRYDVTGFGDENGIESDFATYFMVSGSGLSNTLGFYILIVALSFGVIIFGISIQDPPITILGTFGLYFLGMWILFNGIDFIKDTTYTWAMGIIILSLASYISFRASYELITD